MPTGILKKNEIVSLDIEQVASVCCVSVARVDRWIDVRGLRVSGQGECRNILSSDLVDFLVQYNMPIPEIILPAQAKKILFVFKNETLEFIYVKFLIEFFWPTPWHHVLQTDHFGLDLFGKLPVDIFKVGGFAATAGAVIDYFYLNDFFPEIDKAHNTLPWPSADRQ